MIQIKKITTEETYPIRLEVLRKNIPLPYEFKGDKDDGSFHLGAFKDGKLIAVSSFIKSSNPSFEGSHYQLRGMATLPEYRGSGAGKLMLEEGLTMLKKLNIDFLWCNARLVAVDFYKKQGLKTLGELFDIKYVGPHYIMYKDLKNEN